MSDVSMSHEDGYTLTEMIVVMTIVAVAMTSIVSVIARPSDRLEISEIGAQAETLFRAARSRALMENIETRVDLFRQEGVLRSERLGRALSLRDEMVAELTTARAEISDEDRASIRFLPDGRSTGGDLLLIKGKYMVRISVDWLTGAISRTDGEH